MIDLIPILLYMVAGLAVGILAGLLPALPAWTGPFLLLQFHQGMTLTVLLVFWLTVYSGSQFFGSIAVITTKIPGEESAMIYLDDLKKFNLIEKNYLLYDTALGSTIAAAMATVFVWILVSYTGIGQSPWIFSIKVQTAVYGLLILSFMLINKSRWFLVLLTMLFGISIAPANNYALPPLWYDWQYLFDGYTFYLVILGTLIIPEMLSYKIDLGDETLRDKYAARSNRHFSWWLSIRASIAGFIVGLIPGPSASLGSITAYKLFGNTPGQKIVAAESANNSAVIASTIPFFIMALPVNNNTILMSGIMDMHGLLISEDILGASGFFSLNIIDFITIAMLCVIALFYLLSTTLIDFYVKLIVLLHSKINIVLTSIIVALIYIDLSSAEVTVPHYFALMAFFTALGLGMKKLGVSAVPLMFSILLGDKLVWATIQLSILYL